MDIKKQMESIYRDLSLGDIPWNLKDPPELLVQLVESRWILPCPAVDLGCGAGNYAVWLALNGFQMTGIDISPKAIELASRLAEEKGVDCHFIDGNLTQQPLTTPRSFEFAYDWEVLHHIFPEERERYVDNVHRLLRTGGKYLSVCFAETDPSFGGKGKYRITPLGTRLYFSCEDELRALFEPKFIIEKLYTTDIAGKYGPHQAVIGQMERQ